MATTSNTSAIAAAPLTSDDRWTKYSATVLTICVLGWAFDIYEATIMQLVTPILIKEWNITPTTMGAVTTISRWVGLIGTFAFPALADLYGRRRVLIWSILGYSVLTGLTGFSIDWSTLLIFSSLTRIALAGENPVGMLLVTETAPKKWRATALGGLVGGYPLGYFLCTVIALYAVPTWGWRSLYFLGIVPALLVLWVRLGINESPRYERVTAEMLREGIKKRLDIWSPFRSYPRESFVATLIYFLYLFTWVGWSAWMPFYLANERHLGFPTMASYLSVWMACAIFAYWLCGWLCDIFGRRWVIPAFAVPAAILLVAMGYCETPTSLLWVGLATNFLITGSFGTGLGYTAEIFPTQIRGTAVGATFAIGLGLASTAPMIMGWIATNYSVAAGLPLLALSFFLLGPLFFWFAPDVTRKELADFVGQKVG
jgi:AAHS family cis,cis-muconate transporter-like MFS transporter